MSDEILLPRLQDTKSRSIYIGESTNSHPLDASDTRPAPSH
ncbi:hypothetical protein TYRP_006198 [Tyrophagus putrescentiae]|nr:hypothetical protein TYRP_006198 [Tyrophagus putrescentiae]